MKLKYSTQVADDIRDKLSLKKKTHTNFVGIYLFNTLGTFAVNFRSNFSDKTDYNIIIPYQNKEWDAFSTVFMYNLDARH